MPGLFDELFKSGRGIGETVTVVKIVAGILATQGSRSHTGVEGSCDTCRLCGKCQETNYHVLAESQLCGGDSGDSHMGAAG